MNSSAEKGTVVFEGGYETDPRDGGRPVRLIASALKVQEQVFRDAFSGVNPSRVGPPSPSRARTNKKVLMDALGPHGVSNQRLDEVSNYYRYRPESGELWQHRPASAEAVIIDGKVVDIKIIDAGSGYMKAPTVRVAGYDVNVNAAIEFSKDFESNGRITKLEIATP